MNYIRIVILSVLVICTSAAAFAVNNEKMAISFHGIATSPKPNDLPYIAEDIGKTIFFSKNPFISNVNETKYIESIQFIEKEIKINLTKVGEERFHDFTKSNLGKRMAVRINGNIVTAPVIRSVIAHGGMLLPASVLERK